MTGLRRSAGLAATALAPIVAHLRAHTHCKRLLKNLLDTDLGPHLPYA